MSNLFCILYSKVKYDVPSIFYLDTFFFKYLSLYRVHAMRTVSYSVLESRGNNIKEDAK